MKIEKISQERLQLLVSAGDLASYGIDIKDLWQNTPGAQKFFSSIIKQLLDKNDLRIQNQRQASFTVEAIGLIPEGVIVILHPCEYSEYQANQDIEERASNVDDDRELCYTFNNFEDLYELCTRLINIGQKEGSIYHMDGHFYFLFESEKSSSQLLALLSEYGEKSGKKACFLKEHGKVLEALEGPRFISQLFEA
ncbi:adaptor protein MecA [Heliorestis convoluta]|uniref:Adapter protein MecA n=1 Tax=Heliorestis convoluta TaxID=356322 RepID=A0A5Q2N1T1_9FIRM|nr:adaptor protein MecA [Heliorestis convoluta]QGG48251.1 Adapter protein MecA [Heliorestis convoluta]